MLSIKLNHEFNYNTLLTIYNKLGLDNPFLFSQTIVMKQLNRSDLDDKTKLKAVVNARCTGKTTFNTILAILAASNNITVVYIVPNYHIAKDVELKIIDLSVRLGFNETSIRNYIRIQIGDTIKGMIEKDSLTIDDRK